MLNKAEPLRGAHVMGKFEVGGVVSFVMNYYRRIDRKKVQFDFIIDEDSTIADYDEIEKLGGRVFKIPPYQKPIAYHMALVKLFRKQQWQIVHSNINTLNVFPLFAAKRSGVPVRIAHSHSTAGKGEILRNIIKSILRPFSRVFPTHCLACGEHAARWLFGDKLYSRGGVRLVPYAIELSKFRFDPRIRDTVRNELSVSDKFVVGHVGRFMLQKNHNFLIDIFEQIRALRSDSVLLLIGEGPLEKEIRGKVQALGLNSCVRFLGIRNDANKLFMAMDVFLLPSLYEGLPVVSVEAQASGMTISNIITSKAKLTDCCEFMDLSAPASSWAERVIAARRESRADANKEIGIAGYDIRAASEKLAEFYMETV